MLQAYVSQGRLQSTVRGHEALINSLATQCPPLHLSELNAHSRTDIIGQYN